MDNTSGKTTHLPAEMLTEIFRHVDLRTLVFSCRLVCHFWRNVVESSKLWRTKLFLTQEKDVATDVARVGYPWYICYAVCKHVFNTNLFPFSEGSSTFWKEADTMGFIWSAPLYAYTLGFPDIPQEMLPAKDSTSYLCGIGESSITHRVDLYALGLTRKILEFQPPIHISERYSTRYSYDGTCHIEVKLFNSDWKCDTKHGHFKYRKGVEWRKWHKVSHTFRNYSPDVRYVVLLHGINTRLPHFHGIFTHFEDSASKIMGTTLSVGMPNVCGPPVTSTYFS